MRVLRSIYTTIDGATKFAFKCLRLVLIGGSFRISFSCNGILRFSDYDWMSETRVISQPAALY